MMIITGDLMIKEGHMPQAMQTCQKHVAYSLTEPGCISHGVYQDPEDGLRLFFYVQWEHQASIDAHFVLPSSQAFVAAVRISDVRL